MILDNPEDLDWTKVEYEITPISRHFIIEEDYIRGDDLYDLLKDEVFDYDLRHVYGMDCGTTVIVAGLRITKIYPYPNLSLVKKEDLDEV